MTPTMPSPPVDHFAVGDWVYNETAHWHVCSECGYDTFDFGLHNFVFPYLVCVHCVVFVGVLA